MKRLCYCLILLVTLTVACVTGGNVKPAGNFQTENDAVLESGPMGYILTSPVDGGVAVTKVKTYKKSFTATFRLKSAVTDGPQNGFIVLRDDQSPDANIYAGMFIGGQAFSIEGNGVTEGISVPMELDFNAEYKITVFVDFEKGIIEMRSTGKEISTKLSPVMKQVNITGYRVNNTKTHFSRIDITGK